MKKIKIDKDWKQKNGMYMCPLCKKEFSILGIPFHIYKKHTEKGRKQDPNIGYKNGTKRSWNKGLTKETDERVRKYATSLSIKRKEWLKNNKDKHNWNYNKNKSIPCEIIKNKLRELKIQFIDEYIPYNDKCYSIDIAFPDKMMGIEINGNQHYNKDGTLTLYYQKRHNFFEERGWKIYEFHFSLVYNGFVLNKIIEILNKSNIIISFDYNFWIREPILKKENREKLKQQKIKLNQEKIEKIKQELLNSNIYFSKFGWVNQASKIIKCKSQKVNKWMKKYMSNFYDEKCFKRKNVKLKNYETYN